MPLITENTMEEYNKTYKEERVSFATLHYKEVDEKINGSKIVLLSDCILDKYNKILVDFIVSRTLTDAELRKYQYNPKLLSYDLYGTTELWFMILHANQLHSITQFYINPIKVYTPGVLRIIESILNLERQIIDSNENDIYKAIS